MPRPTRSPVLRKAVILLTSAVAVSYLVYRGLYTLNLTSAYASFASLFLYVGEVYGVVNMLLYFVQVWEVYEPPERPPLPNRTVDVFVPTYNEDPDLLRLTLLACAKMDYPHKTYLCDDGGTEARCNDPEKGPPSRERQAKLLAICEEVGAIYCTRPKNEHAKAGNLNYAFERTDGEFLIIFDADHVPEPNFISRLLGYFEDPKLAFVQTPHAFYNFESFQARLSRQGRRYWEEGQLFYHVIQPGRNKHGCPIFAGSAALFRREALKQVGYIATETITEDMHTGMRMHSRGWTSLGISERMVAGQAAQDVTTFHSQRLRWGEGNISVIFYDNPLTMRGLTIGQRLCYLATVLNWGGGLFKLAIYLTPLLMLFTGVPPVAQFTWGLAAFMGLYMGLSILGTKVAGNGYGSFWYSELFTMASFWTQVQGTMKALFWRKFQQFVVTAKRGRQSKSIWPYIRPQVYLMLFSVLALVWAWSRLGLGVSDDPFKPMLATFWACFHMLLAYLYIRRAYWPEDRRFATRHTAFLPVSYKAADTPAGHRKLGFTTDLNDQGCTLIAYQPLAEGSHVRLTIQGADGGLEVLGLVKCLGKLAPGPEGQPGGFRHGIQFQVRSDKLIDQLNLLCLHYAVPKLYRGYAEGHTPVWIAVPRWIARRTRFRRFSERREFRLPLFLFPSGQPGRATYAVTEDVSTEAMAVLLPTRLEKGAEVRYAVTTPLGELSGTGKVVVAHPVVYAARTFYRTAIAFDHLEEADHRLVRTLFRSATRKKLRPLLEPKKLPVAVPINKPLAVGVLIATLLTAAEFGVFRFAYQDDFFLRRVARSDGPLAAEDAAEVDRIFQSTMKDAWPGTDRLVLLTQALGKMDRPTEVAELVRKLAPRDPDNLDLQLALAFAHDQREDFPLADAEFRKLLAALDRGTFPEGRREEVLAGAARAAAHSGDIDLAGEYYRPLMERFRDKPLYRNEYAGALLGARRYRDAADVLRGGDLDTEGRTLLILVHTAAADWDAAEREARALVNTRPNDPTAEALLADVLNGRGDFRQAQTIYERVLKAGGDDLRIALQLANVSLWAKQYDDALDRFQAVIDRHADLAALFRKYPQVRRGYVNAAASAGKLGEPHRRAAVRLFEDAQAEKPADAVYLARLGWVLQRLGEVDKSADVLDQAVALEPGDPGFRRQLAGALVAAGRAEAALRLLEAGNPGPEGRLLLADAYMAIKNFDAAEKECRAVLETEPANKDARVKLANVLSWKGDYPQSRKLFEELIREFPADPELPVRVAQVALWSGDYSTAADRFRVLLATDFDRPWLWYEYVDAAASAKKLTTEQDRLTRAIADRVAAGDHVSPRAESEARKAGRTLKEGVFLTRLAWVLWEHVKDAGRATTVLDKAVALPAGEPAARKELAGVLAAAKRFDEALTQYDGLTLGPDERLGLARIYAAAGRFPQAIEQCKEVLKTRPLDREARTTLADALSFDGRFAESLALFDTLLEMNPGDAELRRRRAEVTLWSGDVAGGLTRFEELLRGDADNPKLGRGFIEAAGRTESLSPDQLKLAQRVVSRPDVTESKDTELLARAGWVLFRHLNDEAGSTSLLVRAMGARPKDAAVLTRLAWALHRAGHKGNADVVLGEAVALAPKDPRTRRELAGVLTAVGRFPDALTMYAELAKADPADRDLESQIAQVTLWSGDAPGALVRLEKVLGADFQRPALWPSFVDAAAAVPALSPAQVELVKKIAAEQLPGRPPDEQAVYASRLAWVLHRAAAAPAEVTRLLDHAVALKPVDAKARAQVAGVLAAAGRFADALPWTDELAKANPADADLQRRFAEVALGAGAYDRVAERLTPMLDGNFDQPPLWLPFVDAVAGMKRGAVTPTQVKLLGRLAARPVPDAVADKALYLSRLAWALHREGQTEAAGPLLEQAVALAPKDAKTRRELAGLLTAAGRFKEARAWLEDLAAANPKDIELLGRVAEVALWGGDRAVALDRLTRALEANFELTQFWASFVDAASPANKGELTPEQMRLAERLATRPVPAGVPESSAYLSRLGWVLHRDGRKALAEPLLEKAAADPPKDPKARRELGGVLTAAGKVQEGLKLFEGVTLTADDRLQLTALYAAAKQFDRAAEQAEAVVRERPDDRSARRWLADVTLWGTNYAKALPLYAELLSPEPAQADLWPGFVESAVNAGTVTDAQANLAVEIAAHPDAARSTDIVFLARLGLLLHRDAEGRETVPRLAAAAVGSRGPLLASAAIAAARARQTRAPAFIDQALRSRPRDATILARLGWAVHQAGYTDQAAKVLDEATALKPVEPAVRREVGDVLVATGRLRPALAWFEAFAAAHPTDLELQARLAEVTVWAGEYAKGLTRLEAALAADFDRPTLWRAYADGAAGVTEMTPAQLELMGKVADREPPVAWGVTGRVVYYSRLAWAFHREGERTKSGALTARAGRLLDAAVGLQPTELKVRLELAGVLVAARRYGPALVLYEELERELPNDPDVRTQVAKLLVWDNRPGPALAKLEELLRPDFRRPDLWRMYAMAAGSVKSMPASQVELLARIADQPADGLPDPAAHRARLAVALTREGTALKDANLIRLAQDLLDRAISPLPDSPADRRELAGVLAAAGRPKLALDAVRGLDLTDAAGRALMADLYAANGDMASAEREARALLRLRPDDWEAKFTLASVLGWGGEHGEAAALYRALGRERPADGRVPVRLAQMALWSGNHDDALGQFVKLLDAGARNGEVVTGFIDAAAGAARLDAAARKSALVVSDLYRSDATAEPQLVGRLAWVMTRLREHTRAAELLTRLLAADPQSRDVRRRLAEALTEAGELKEAEKHYRVLLRTSPDRRP